MHPKVEDTLGVWLVEIGVGESFHAEKRYLFSMQDYTPRYYMKDGKILMFRNLPSQNKRNDGFRH